MGGRDLDVLSPSARAAARTTTETAAVAAPGAGHPPWAEPGALKELARLSGDLFARRVKG